MKERGIRTRAVWMVCCILATAVSSCAFHSKAPPPPPPTVEAPAAPPPAPELPYHYVDYRYPLWAIYRPELYIYKGERKLLLVNDGVLVRDYPIALGFSPKGDKHYQGDGRTPEGEYFICKKNPASKYYKSLGLNYPSPRHANDALGAGSISSDQYKKIIEANNKLALPPGNTLLGGLIFIHGGGTEKDWTLGCIALNNRDMDELFQVVAIGTPVKIKP